MGNSGAYFPKVPIVQFQTACVWIFVWCRIYHLRFRKKDRNPLLKTHQVTADPLGKLPIVLSERVDLALSEGRRLDFRMVSHLPPSFSEEDRSHISETNHLTSAPLWKLRTVLSGSVDLAPRLYASAFSNGAAFISCACRIGYRPSVENTSDNCDALVKLRTLLAESVDLALSHVGHLVFRMVPHLSAVFQKMI